MKRNSAILFIGGLLLANAVMAWVAYKLERVVDWWNLK